MRIRTPILVAAVVVATGLGLGLGVGLGGGSHAPPTTVGAGQLASIQTACQQWLRNSSTEPGTRRWCTDMTQWMANSVDRGWSEPQTMWGDPARLGASCQRWLGTRSPAGAPKDATAWCLPMVSWMATHVGSWSGRRTWDAWIRHGPMMFVDGST